MLTQTERHVVKDRQAVEKRRHLKQKPESQPHLDQRLAVQIGQIAAVEPDAPLGGPQQADDQLEHHCLAAAALADDAQRLAAMDRQIDVAEYRLMAELHVTSRSSIRSSPRPALGLALAHKSPWAWGQIER